MGWVSETVRLDIPFPPHGKAPQQPAGRSASSLNNKWHTRALVPTWTQGKMTNADSSAVIWKPFKSLYTVCKHFKGAQKPRQLLLPEHYLISKCGLKAMYEEMGRDSVLVFGSPCELKGFPSLPSLGRSAHPNSEEMCLCRELEWRQRTVDTDGQTRKRRLNPEIWWSPDWRSEWVKPRWSYWRSEMRRMKTHTS